MLATEGGPYDGEFESRQAAWGEGAKLPRAPTRAFLAAAAIRAKREVAKTLTRSSRHRIHAITTLSLRHPSIVSITHTHARTLCSSCYSHFCCDSPFDSFTDLSTAHHLTRASRCHASPSAAQSSLNFACAGQDAPASSPDRTATPSQHRQSAIITLATSHSSPNNAHRLHPSHRPSTTPSHLRRVATQRQHALRLDPRAAYARTPLSANCSR